MTSPPNFDAFLRAILDRPDDGLPCLVAADWCGECGLDGVEAMLRAGKPRLPVDDLTARACRRLLALNFAGVIARVHDRLSPKQYLWVWRLVLKYRLRVRDRELIDRAADLLPTAIAETP